MKKEDLKKRERIIGLIVGLIFFSLLFCFNFYDFEFEYVLNSPIGKVCKGIANAIYGIATVSEIHGLAKIFWYGTAIIYLFLIWKYRSCIGYWIKKVITSGFKKI